MTETFSAPTHPRPAEPGGLAERLRRLAQARAAEGETLEVDATGEWQSVVSERLSGLEKATCDLRPQLDQLLELVQGEAEQQNGRATRNHAELVTDLRSQAGEAAQVSAEILAGTRTNGELLPAIADAVVSVSDQVTAVATAFASTHALIEAGLLDLGAAVANLGRQLAESEERRSADRERFRQDLDDALVVAVEVLLTGGRAAESADGPA